MDSIVALLIAEAAAHAPADYTSIADALILIATLMAWNHAVNALSYYVPVVERFASSPPTEIVRDGRMLRRNMWSEY
jgi:uncharacterized membrane protein YcaP (DUF421 family)